MGDDAQIAQRALEDAFGESSDSNDEAMSPIIEEDRMYNWEFVEGVDGLWLCRDFLSEKHQNLILSAIRQEGWFNESSHNQAMRFGDLPDWATELTRLVRKAICFSEIVRVNDLKLDLKDQLMEGSEPLSFDLLWREPFFDQLIANVYQPGEGICAHVDLMRFEDGIAIVSMESECVMHFSRADQETGVHEVRCNQGDSQASIPVLLNPGSLILMSGEARYFWKHEINRKAGFQIWKGREIFQQRRTSVTLRKLHRSSDDSQFG